MRYTVGLVLMLLGVFVSFLSGVMSGQGHAGPSTLAGASAALLIVCGAAAIVVRRKTLPPALRFDGLVREREEAARQSAATDRARLDALVTGADAEARFVAFGSPLDEGSGLGKIVGAYRDLDADQRR
jgi:hypothetical protein